MHVCLITTQIYPLDIGGPGNIVTFLSRALDKLGVKVSLVFPVYDKKITDERLRRILGVTDNVHLLPIYTTWESWNSNKKILLNLLSWRSLLNYFSDKVDIMHFQYFPSLSDGSFLLPYVIKLKAKQLVLTYHGSIKLEAEAIGRYRGVMAKGFKLTYFNFTKKLFDNVICMSHFSANSMLSEGFSPEKIKVIPPGIDIDMFKKARALELEGEPAILWVGYADLIKGADLMLKAFKNVCKKLPKARLHFVGGYEEDRYFIPLSKELGVYEKMKIYGPVHPEKVPSFYKGADICVNSSRFETCGLVPLEAMAAGKPLIATNVGGVPEKVKNYVNGILVDLSSESIGNAIVKVWNEPELRFRLAKNAIRQAENFSWEKTARRYLQVYSNNVRMPRE